MQTPSVEPEHLAYAFSIANAIHFRRAKSIVPSSRSFEYNGHSYSFSDDDENRVSLNTISELRSFIPGDDVASITQRGAVMVRVLAVNDALRRPTVETFAHRRQDGSYFLDSRILKVFASAPLDKTGIAFKKKALDKLRIYVGPRPYFLT